MVVDNAHRRRVLCSTAAVLAGSAAGCLDSLPGFGQSGESGTDSTPFRTWIPSADALGVGQTPFVAYRPSRLERVSPASGNFDVTRFVASPFQPYAREADRMIVVFVQNGEAVVVLLGSFEAAAVTDDVVGAGFEQSDDGVAGYDLYESGSGVVAVSDDRIIHSTAGQENLETVLDARAGTVERTVEAVPAVGDAIDPFVASGVTGPMFAARVVPDRIRSGQFAWVAAQSGGVLELSGDSAEWLFALCARRDNAAAVRDVGTLGLDGQEGVRSVDTAIRDNVLRITATMDLDTAARSDPFP